MTTGSGTIVIRPGREKPIRQQHPWIFSGAIERVEGDPTPGDIVTVTGSKGRFLARGYWNPKSQIQVRILTWQDEPIDETWWRRMLKRAIDGRKGGTSNLLPIGACRLINAENDYIPGLVVDRYENWLVLQALTLGIERHKTSIAELLQEILKTTNTIFGIYERSDVDVRGKEGLKSTTGLLVGNAPESLIAIEESATRQYFVDIYKGHKTGFYLDQRANRDLLETLLYDVPEQSSILNLFSYTGGFGICAASSPIIQEKIEQITNVDSSLDALELAEENFRLNEFPPERVEFIQADVFNYLRDQAAEGNQWDVVVLDPPKFAQNARQVDGASRGYKDINLNAFKCVKPGGYLMTFSCSGAVSAELFQKIVFGALADSGRQAQILKHLGPGDDHPVALTFPEGAYLKGLLLRVY